MPSSAVFALNSCRRSSFRLYASARCISRNAEFYAYAARHPEQASPLAFEALGIQRPIVDAVCAAFPNIRSPTDMQSRFIPAIMSGNDVLLKDEPGTGKSFGVIIALLSKPRLRQIDSTLDKISRTSITSLLIVPHRDLVLQFGHWIHQMVSVSATSSQHSISSVYQVLLRDQTTPLVSRISKLKSEPPHILIGTPQALLEACREDKDALKLSSLSTVVVDEVDYLVESVPRKPSSKMMEKARKKLDRHPSATRQLLDLIYEPRIKASLGDTGELQSRKGPRLPQLVMSSATLRNHLKLYLFNESGWLRKEKVQKYVGSRTPPKYPNESKSVGVASDLEDHGESGRKSGSEVVDKTQYDVVRDRVTHCVLVVSKNGDIKNIDGAIHAEDTGNRAGMVAMEDRKEITAESLFDSQDVLTIPAIDHELEEKFANTPLPFDMNALEAIATAFALDVPSAALLVLPATGPVNRMVYELRKMGVNARGLDLDVDGQGRGQLVNSGAEAVKENPILLISTMATTRGLDFPEMTHVFILGLLEGRGVDGRTLDSYLHISGRVGRFGRCGKVVSVLREDGESGESGGRHEEVWRMSKVLKELRIVARRFSHFD